MPTIDEKQITMTYGQVASLAVVLAGAVAASFYFFVGGVASDVDDIRQDLREMRSGVALDATKGASTTFDLSKSISQIEKDVAVVAERVLNIDKTMSEVEFDVGNIDANSTKLVTQYEDLDARLTKIEAGLAELSSKKGGGPELLPRPQ